MVEMELSWNTMGSKGTTVFVVALLLATAGSAPAAGSTLVTLPVAVPVQPSDEDRPAEADPCSDRCPIVAASLDLHHDPGHSGVHLEYELVRQDSGDEIRRTLWPPRVIRGPDGRRIRDTWEPPEVTRLERSADQVDAFLAKLLAKDACRLDDPERRIGLHPTFSTLTIRDACGNERSTKWVSEHRRHPDERFERIRNPFEAFFEPEE